MSGRKRTLGQLIGDNAMTQNRTRFYRTSIYIYAFINSAGDVLYVGRTYDPRTRVGAHRAKAPWWTPDTEFALIEVVETGWDDAKDAEFRAIRTLQPRWNRQLAGPVIA